VAERKVAKKKVVKKRRTARESAALHRRAIKAALKILADNTIIDPFARKQARELLQQHVRDTGGRA
jgi:hypothetical protein